MGYYISIMHIPKEDLTQDMLEYAELHKKEGNILNLVSSNFRKERNEKMAKTLKYIYGRLKSHFIIYFDENREEIENKDPSA